MPESTRNNGQSARTAGLARHGDYWSIFYEGRIVQLKDSKGLRQLAYLISNPGREFHVLDLTQLTDPRPPVTPAPEIDRAELAGLGLHSSSNLAIDEPLDAKARTAYKQRLLELRDALDDARELHDQDRIAGIEDEIDSLTRELSHSLLGWLVTRVTGQSLADYMSQKLWQPLGMEQDATWMADSDGPQGLEMGACCLNATLRDYARFGLLFLNKGNWRGRQIVPKQWVEDATNPQKAHVLSGRVLPGTPLGYGYLWWTLPGSDHAFSAWGLYQQFIYVNPAYGVVIVKTSASKANNNPMETFTAFVAICRALESR